MDEKLKENIKRQSTWMRGLYMILFALIYSAVKIVVFVIVLFQFLMTLVAGNVNERLLILGQRLSTYIYQIMLFFTYNSEEKPYPFAPWPEGPPEGETRAAVKKEPKLEKEEAEAKVKKAGATSAKKSTDKEVKKETKVKKEEAKAKVMKSRARSAKKSTGKEVKKEIKAEQGEAKETVTEAGVKSIEKSVEKAVEKKEK